MNSERVLYFLGMLNHETTGHSEEIVELYKRALDEDDDISRLKMLLDEHAFYREIGNSLYKSGEELVDQVYATPGEALEILPRVRQVGDKIEQAARIGNDLIRSPLPFSEPVTVLKKKNTIAYMSALKMIASTSVYLMALYGGLNPIKNLTWNDSVGIQEMIYAINTKFLPGLCAVKRPNYSWVIRKKKLGGRALFGGEFFCLSYENSKNVEVLCSSLHKEPMGTHSYLNINAYETGELDVPFCWGIGNIVSVSPGESIRLLQKDVTSEMRSPYGAELLRRMPAPMECVRLLTANDLYCITPDNLVLAMNQWQTGYEIEKRRRMHNCLFCGKHVDGSRLVCSTHFTSEL